MDSPTLVDFETAPFEIIDGDRGKNYPKQNEFSDSGHCLFLSAANVTRSGFEFSECQFITEQKDETLRKGKLQCDDIVLTTRGTIGNTAHFHSSVPYEHMRINSGMVILRCNLEEISPTYLYQFSTLPLISCSSEFPKKRSRSTATTYSRHEANQDAVAISINSAAHRLYPLRLRRPD